MYNTLWSLFLQLIGLDSKSEHTRWLERRLPHMMEFDDPTLFNRPEYQKEGLLVLMASAHKVQKAWKHYTEQPTNSELEHSYQFCRNLYTYDVETLRLAHPVFKDLDIHWSNLHEFIKQWQKKNPTKWSRDATRQMCLLEC